MRKAKRALYSRLYVFTTDRLNSSDRTYKAYLLLLQLVPRLKEILEDSSVDTDAFDHFIAQVRCHLDIRVSNSFNILCSSKRVRMMHAVTMSGA